MVEAIKIAIMITEIIIMTTEMIMVLINDHMDLVVGSLLLSICTRNETNVFRSWWVEWRTRKSNRRIFKFS